MSDKVIIGLSGGVDSAMAAWLLLQQGYDVEAVFMQNWEDELNYGSCTAQKDLEHAIGVARHLKIKLHVANFSAQYKEQVFQHFLSEYKVGHTPNPDILCNKLIKFAVFLQYAKGLAGRYIATGHYAGIRRHVVELQLLKSTDLHKDQTYFLYTLNQEQLRQIIFPLANITKDEVKKKLMLLNFPNALAKNSTGVCFISPHNFKNFLQKFIPKSPGKIVTYDGKVLGEHDGLAFYTIGQRHGLCVGGRAHYKELPWYVARKNLSTNELLVVQGEEHPALFAQKLIAKDIHWINGMSHRSINCTAKIRYRQQEQLCTVEINELELMVTFSLPQRAITPGQAIVFYDQEVCLGGATIEKVVY